MPIVDLLAKHRVLAMFSLAALIMVAGTIVWWRFPTSSLTAQERMADICATGEYPESYDLLDRTTYGPGSDSGVIEYNVRVDDQGKHYLVSVDGALVQEGILIYADGTGGSGRSANPRSGGSATAYMRMFDDGEWGDWDVSTDGPGSASGTASSSTRMSSSASTGDTDTEEIESFCGLLLAVPGAEVEFRYVGEETINGVATDHYYHRYSRIGEDHYDSTEFWFDSNGLFRQVKQVSYNGPGTGDEVRISHLKTYSGWGEANIITAPVRPTSTPDAPTR